MSAEGYDGGRPRRGGRHAVAVAVAALAMAVVATACSSTGGRPRDTGGGEGGGTVDTPRLVVSMVTHEAPGDSFWDLVRKGAETAARKDNIELRYSADPEAPNQANLVQSAVDSGVDGIVVTLAKPDAMRGAVRTAVERGIPVTGLNSGLDAWQALGVSQFFGQDETIAGRAAGDRLDADGARRVLCVIHEQGNVGHESRCAGVRDAFDGRTDILYVNGKDMPSVDATLTAKLQQDREIDTVLTLGAPFAVTAVGSVERTDSTARVATFDTNAALVENIQNGSVAWAVDQQPYLQGYLAVDALWLQITNANTSGGGGPVLTGPSFIDATNIDAVAALVADGTR